MMVRSGTKGLFGGISIGATDVVQNTDLDEAYYHGLVDTKKILAGQVHNPAAHPLQEALATRVASE
jgi:lipid-binding SYLF domain-containing protein